LWLTLLVVALPAAPASADVFDDNLAAASRGAGDLVVLARGADGSVYERHTAGGAWSPWTSIGGAATSGPAAAAYGDAVHAFVPGSTAACTRTCCAPAPGRAGCRSAASAPPLPRRSRGAA